MEGKVLAINFSKIIIHNEDSMGGVVTRGILVKSLLGSNRLFLD
jgi:hypothetical protein